MVFALQLLSREWLTKTDRDFLNECIAISRSLPEGDGQFARANYRLSPLYRELGKVRECEEYMEKARAMRRRISKGTVLEDDESIVTYDKLNLWMLW